MQFNFNICRITLSLLVTGSLVFYSSCNNKEADSVAPETDPNSTIPSPVSIGYTILKSIPHDTAAFTQGLEVYDGALLESTGLVGQSTLRKLNTFSGKIEKKHALPNEIFAEGLTVLNDTIYQLSWQNHLVFMYDAKTFKQLGTLPWSGEGWGITNNDNELIISEGSDKLYFVQPKTLKLNKVLSIRDNYGAVNNLNELEMVDGFIYANRWQYEYILKIDPASGLVVGIINMQDMLQKNTKSDLSYLKSRGNTPTEAGAVLNGMAFDKSKNIFYITGKLWPEIFEVKLN
jgi:glutamine cyclotransferase